MVLAVLVASIVVVPAVAAHHAGALWIPQNDSWAHSRIAQHLAETGEVQLLGFNRASLVGMMYVLGPAGSSLVAHHVAAMVWGAMTLGFSYALAREFLARPAAVLVTLLVGVAPGFVLLGTSYMSDVPMMAGMAGALFFTVRYAASGRGWQLAAALVIGLWGFTVREQALAVVAATLVGAWLWRRQQRRFIAVAAVLSLLAVVAFQWWRRSLGNDDPPQLSLEVGYTVQAVVMALLSLSAILAPALFLAAGRLKAARSHLVPIAAGSLGLVGGLGLLAMRGAGVLLGNYFAGEGAYLAMFHGTRHAVPTMLMRVAAVLAVMSLSVLIALAVMWILKRLRARALDPIDLLLVFVAIYVAGLIVQTLVGQGLFERYFYPLIAPLAIIALRGVRRSWPRVAAAGVALVVIAVITTLITANTWASTGAVWRAAEAEVQAGTDPRHIDAGFAWVGWHSGAALAPDPVREEQTIGWWAHVFPDSQQCVVVSIGTGTGEPATATTSTYPRYIVAGTDEVVVEHLETCR